MEIRIAPLRSDFLTRVRSEGLDDLGQPVQRLRSLEGGEPCRDVLRRAEPGEELVLASYCPFSKSGPYKEYGPVFVLAEPSKEKVIRNRLPVYVPDGQTSPYLRKHFVLRAYNQNEAIIDAVLVTPEEAEDMLERFLAQEDVAFVHARFPTYGCFSCHIERDE